MKTVQPNKNDEKNASTGLIVSIQLLTNIPAVLISAGASFALGWI